ncbi:MAG TPA: LuxR C-terminal-related transcriptional regulator [Symbiobacteriaceae bacterium]|nr:LuxR C-terminal-related transcriptional regulator [Symbiobacteriaceae bacterium]
MGEIVLFVSSGSPMHGRAADQAREGWQTQVLVAVAEHYGIPHRLPGEEPAWAAHFSSPDAALAAANWLQQGAPGSGRTYRMAIDRPAAPASAMMAAASALLAIARPGEILLSEQAEALVRACLPPAMIIEPLSPHRRGQAPGSPAGYLLVPASAGASVPEARVPTNLPTLAGRFIGRREEAAVIGGHLATARTVLLMGPPGSGKTRLAVEVGWAERERFAGGVWFVDLTVMTEPDIIVQVAAAAVGIKDEPGRDLLTALTAFLAGQPTLLILDNCEHVAAACGDLILRLLQACPHLRILVTSQMALPVPCDVHCPMGGLDLPAAGHRPEPADLLVSTAARLFAERAMAADASFAITSENASAIVQVCTYLDGLPLALELAAARVSLMSVQEIARRLDAPFRLLSRGQGGVVTRYETLRTALDWYYDLFSSAAQMLWRRLSVFAGPFSLAAAEHLCSGDDDVVEPLGELVRRSVLSVEPHHGEKYFRLPESFRQYGREHLARSGGEDELYSRLRDYVAGLVSQLAGATGAPGPAQGTLLATLDASYENVRLTLRWSLEHGQAEAAAQMTVDLMRYWHMRGRLTEGRYWLERVLGAYLDPTALQARVLQGCGTFAFLQGDNTVAGARLQRSLAAARALGDKPGMVRTLSMVANLAGVQGDDAGCRAAYDEALVLLRELADRKALAAMLNNAALLPKLQGEYAAARRLFEESLVLQRAEGTASDVALVLTNLGDIARWEGDAAKARAAYEEALVLAKSAGSVHALLRVFLGLGEMAMAEGHLDQGAAYAEEARRLSTQQSFQHGLVSALGLLGQISRLRGEFAQAHDMLQESLATAVKLKDMRLVAEALESIAWVADAQGQWRRSVRLFAAAQALRGVVHRPSSPDRHEAQQKRLSQLRQVLGPGAFRSAQAAGEAMGPLQAIAYAQSPEPAESVRRRGRPRHEGGLTPREEEVVRLIMAGATSQEIGRRLCLSQRTVEKYEERIRAKLALPNRASLAAWAAQHLTAGIG